MAGVLIDAENDQDRGEGIQDHDEGKGQIEVGSRQVPSSLESQEVEDDHPARRQDEIAGIGDGEAGEEIETDRGEKEEEDESHADEIRPSAGTEGVDESDEEEEKERGRSIEGRGEIVIPRYVEKVGVIAAVRHEKEV